jgi:uncharacterized protein YeeX (DUF496 family)
MNETKTYLDISINDLNAAKSLFQNKHFSQAIYFLQQSVEIAFKSFALFTNNLTEDQLKKQISHKSQKVFFRIAKSNYNEFHESWENIKKAFPNVQYDTLEFVDHIQQVLDSKNFLQDLEGKIYNDNIEVVDILKSIEEIVENLCNIENIEGIINFNKDNYEETIAKLGNFISPFLGNEKASSLIAEINQIPLEDFKSLMRKQYIYSSYTSISTQTLFWLSVILSPHN